MEKSPDQRRKYAVALQYSEGDSAPHVVASGAGELAKRIIELAEQHGVPVKQDDTLAELLSRLPLQSEIPPETYRAVAEILAFLFRSDLAWRKKKQEENPGFGHSRPL